MSSTYCRLSVAGAAIFGALASVAVAAPLLDVSRTSISFGRLPAGVEFVQPVFLTNVGDMPLTLSGFPVTGKDAADYAPRGPCTATAALVPGERCRLDVNASLISDTNSTALLTIQSNSLGGPLDVSLSAIISSDLTSGLYATPAWIDFDHQAVGTASSALTITFTNPESLAHAATLDAVELDGKNASDFAMTTDCVVGKRYFEKQGCTATVTFTPTANGPRAAQISFAVHPNGGPPRFAVFTYSITGVGGIAMPVDVVEYYNAALDHYFITWNSVEQANLDAGKTPTKWSRTGYSFHAYSAPLSTTSPVCRYYLPPAFGDSHFFGRGTAECGATGVAHPAFVLEDPRFMNTILPSGGACPANTAPVYRVFSNRIDANHRYMTDRTVRDQMVARGWLAEGDGPDLVVMCAP